MTIVTIVIGWGHVSCINTVLHRSLDNVGRRLFPWKSRTQNCIQSQVRRRACEENSRGQLRRPGTHEAQSSTPALHVPLSTVWCSPDQPTQHCLAKHWTVSCALLGIRSGPSTLYFPWEIPLWSKNLLHLNTGEVTGGRAQTLPVRL